MLPYFYGAMFGLLPLCDLTKHPTVMICITPLIPPSPARTLKAVTLALIRWDKTGRRQK